jgi:predicted aldo/keto reductase-like oxidoreductase
MGKALANGWRQKVFLMTKVCTHGRDAKTAMRMLEESLRRLRTDYLDLWQVHEVAYWGDPERHFAKGGVIEALDRARQKGLVRFVGFTGHKDPTLHLQMLAYGYPFDSCQMPLNCFDATFRSFEQQVLPECARQGVAAIGMKTFGGEGDAVKKRVVAPCSACAPAARSRRWTAASSCTRRPPNTRRTSGASSMGSRFRPNWADSPASWSRYPRTRGERVVLPLAFAGDRGAGDTSVAG